MHIDAGLPFELCESPIIQWVIRGIKCYYGEQKCNPKIPITIDILQRLVAIPGDLTTLSDATFDAVVKLAWAGFLHCEEFMLANKEKFDPALHLTCSTVEFIPDVNAPTHICLVLPSSKTDPFCKGVSILIACAPASTFSTCAISALQHLFQLSPQPLLLPLFMDNVGKLLSQTCFISILKSHLARIGLDSSLYSGHSFWQGAASSAGAVSYSDYEIQLLGC